MQRPFDVAAVVSPPTNELDLALTTIEVSATFRASLRHRALLRYLVEHMRAGDLAALKETVIAVAVFRRPVASFDPKLDSIVRVEARRLRVRLDRYYQSEGSEATLRIELPVGSYVPMVREQARATQASETIKQARDLVERGEHFLRQALSKKTLETALARFDEALRTVPDTAAAHVGIGRAWFNLATGWHHPPKIASEHAAEALRRAIGLEPGNATAHAILGAIESQFERDWTRAQRSFRRALALAPQQAFVHSAYGAHLYMHGEFDRADHELSLARKIDPQYVNSRAHMVNLRIAQGRIPEAGIELDALRDVAPQSLAANGLAGVLAMARGDPLSAVAIYSDLCLLAPENPGCFACLAGAQAALGQRRLAESTLTEMRRRFSGSLISPYLLALAATHSRRVDDAFALLERANQERDPSALEIPVDISFRALHSDARWPALVSRVRAAPSRRRALPESRVKAK